MKKSYWEKALGGAKKEKVPNIITKRWGKTMLYVTLPREKFPEPEKKNTMPQVRKGTHC